MCHCQTWKQCECRVAGYRLLHDGAEILVAAGFSSCTITTPGKWYLVKFSSLLHVKSDSVQIQKSGIVSVHQEKATSRALHSFLGQGSSHQSLKRKTSPYTVRGPRKRRFCISPDLRSTIHWVQRRRGLASGRSKALKAKPTRTELWTTKAKIRPWKP